jgi:hypothetical protein
MFLYVSSNVSDEYAASSFRVDVSAIRMWCGRIGWPQGTEVLSSLLTLGYELTPPLKLVIWKVNLKLSLRLINHHAMKRYRRVKI